MYIDSRFVSHHFRAQFTLEFLAEIIGRNPTCVFQHMQKFDLISYDGHLRQLNQVLRTMAIHALPPERISQLGLYYFFWNILIGPKHSTGELRLIQIERQRQVQFQRGQTLTLVRYRRINRSTSRTRASLYPSLMIRAGTAIDRRPHRRLGLFDSDSLRDN